MSSRSFTGRGLAAVLLALFILISQSARATGSFGSGNLVVYRVGDGAAPVSPNGNKVFLDEYTAAGLLVQSIELPSNESLGPNVIAGSAVGEGLLTRSNDARYLVFGGYNTPVGGASDLSNTNVERIFARIDRGGNLDLSTRILKADLPNEPRGACTTNGTDLWVTSGAGGVFYIPLGGSSPNQLTSTTSPVGPKGVLVADGQLYLSCTTAPRLGKVGSNTPTSGGQTFSGLSGISAGSLDAFVFLDLSSSVAGVDTVYVADESATSLVRKYSLVSGSWVSEGSIAAPAGQQVRGLTALADGNNVTLYATSPAKLFTFTDTSGYGASVPGTTPTLSVIATAATNTAFRGVAFTPDASTAIHLRTFEAQRTPDGGTDIRWTTGFEADNLGFNLYRLQDGEKVRVNAALIPGSTLSGVGRVGEGTYAFHDAAAGAAYLLEDVDLSGAGVAHGPYYPSRSIPGVSRIGALSQQSTAAAPALPRRDFVPSEPVARGISSEGLAGGPWLKLGVRHEGIYALSGTQLFAAGLPERVEARSLRLFTEGREVALHIEGAAAGRLQPQSRTLFYGLGLDTRGSDTRIYWLTWGGPPGKRMAAGPPLRRPAPGPAAFFNTLEARDRVLYFAGLQNGAAENFFGAPVTAEGVSQTFVVDHLSGAGGAVEVNLQGLTALGPRPDHEVAVSCNGQRLGRLTWDGVGLGHAAFTLPAGLLQEGENTVQLRSEGPVPDVSLIDSVRLTYPRSFDASGGALRFTAPAAVRIALQGQAAGERVWDVTDAQNPVRVEASPTAGTLDIPGAPGQGRVLFAFADDSLQAPAFVHQNTPSHWSTPGNRADLIVLTPGELGSAFPPLQAARAAEGLRTQIIDVEDVYDEVNWGHPSAEALHRFLFRVHSRWGKRPRYVILAGDATYDPRDYLGFGPVLGVPSAPVDAGGLETVSDDALADFDGDGVPELAVGRIPGRSVEECSAMVEQILAGKTPGGAGVFVSDVPDSYPFPLAAQRAAAAAEGEVRLLPRTGASAQDRLALFSALAQQPVIVSYSGHGSIDFWRGDLLTTSDLAGKPVGVGSVWCLMTCLNGYFAAPALSCLGEALSRSGAGAVWASSGFCTPATQDHAQQAFIRALTRGQRLGDAARSAKRAVLDRDLRMTWILFGDPTRRIH